MFKMCFRTHRTKKIGLKINFFFSSTMKNWGLELSNFFDVPKKKNRKKCTFKICFRTHRIQKIGLKINFFFSSTMKNWGLETKKKVYF